MSPSAGGPPIEIRRATPEDRADVLALLGASLGWGGEEVFDRYFAWKHDENAYGASPAWVATAEGRTVGFRAFLRWELDHPDCRPRRAVRAVDTATHPDFQGRGIFKRLTLHALDELRAEGVDLVFNTPNTQSRPGYLSMGWTEVGRLPVGLRIAGPAAARKLPAARRPAERWSLPSAAGHPAPDVLADGTLDDLLAALPPPDGLRTRRTAASLRWRYRFPELAYRAVPADAGSGLAAGVAVFRLRRRGDALEAVLAEVLVPAGRPRLLRELERAVARASGADHVLRLGGSLVDANRFLRVPRLGPVLTCLPLTDDRAGTSLEDWQLALGDVELL